MVKDSNGRHAGNKLWGDGWGWSWFDADNPSKTTSTDYKTNCQILSRAGAGFGLDLCRRIPTVEAIIPCRARVSSRSVEQNHINPTQQNTENRRREMVGSNQASKVGHLYMQTNEIQNAIMHYHRAANGMITEVDRVATGGAGSGSSSRSAARRARRTPSRARRASSSRRIDVFCLRRMAATIRCPASASVKTAGSRCWTSSQPEIRSREEAARPNRWLTGPQARRCMCCTRSGRTMFA